MNKVTLIVFLLCCSTLIAQVGVGTTDPSAQLDIVTTNTGIPALELNPQSSPSGSVTGQLAVIDDLLYMFDAVRGKWLSVESTAFQFGKNGDGDNELLEFAGDVDESGPKMPFNGTIVYMSIQAIGGNTSKSFDLQINGSDVGNSNYQSIDGRINLSSSAFVRTSYNIDFDEGDVITLEVRSNGSDVEDATAVIWVKWRK